MPTMDVCILAAGRGTRMSAFGHGLNKSLLPVQGVAAISQIIARFPADTRFVIAVGHLGRQIREYLELAHPDTRLELVEVRPFEGAGSGPGTSTLCCEPYLPGPFFLVCSDTYWPGEGRLMAEPRENTAWTGEVPSPERNQYCNLETESGRVVAIHDKVDAGERCGAWVGLAFIRDRNAFFAGLRDSKPVKGENQISSGLKSLAAARALRALPLPGWLDLGTAARYERACQRLGPARSLKKGEFFFQAGERVIKYFEDPLIVQNRVARAKAHPEVFPEVLGQGEHFYSYRYVPGETLYDRPEPALLEEFLEWMAGSVWRRLPDEPADFQAQCLAFYRARTQERIKRAEAQLEERGDVHQLLEQVPWDWIAAGVPSFIHGDLQLDNVVARADGGFTLIDWRQDFAGSLDYGDLHYDFAKLFASIELDFRVMAPGKFPREFRAVVERRAHDQGLEPAKLEVLVALVYLNMSGLHLGEESRFLYWLGRQKLAHALADGQLGRQPTRMTL